MINILKILELMFPNMLHAVLILVLWKYLSNSPIYFRFLNTNDYGGRPVEHTSWELANNQTNVPVVLSSDDKPPNNMHYRC